jgi:hypothetical protein
MRRVDKSKLKEIYQVKQEQYNTQSTLQHKKLIESWQHTLAACRIIERKIIATEQKFSPVEDS